MSGFLNKTKKYFNSIFITAIVATLPEVAASQELVGETGQNPSGSGRIYTPVYFAQYTPRNALDMLEQVPGFAVRDDDQGRGLGQANTNVLINGVRLSSKSQDIRDQLRRVSVDNVEHIEIIDGAMLEIPGLSGQVANVTTRGGDTSGRFEYRNNFRPGYTEPSWLAGEVSASGSTTTIDWNLALSNGFNRGGAVGTSYLTDAAGALTEWREKDIPSVGEYPALSGNLRWNSPGGAVGNFNAQYERAYRDFSNDEVRHLINGTDSFRDFDDKDRNYNYELGADFNFDLGLGSRKLIGLERFENNDSRTESLLNFADDTPSTGNRFITRSESRERIARAEYRWNAFGGNWQLDTELAYNALRQTAQLFNLDSTGGFAEVPFPGGSGGVTEDRYEMILNHGRTFANGMSLQLGLGAENSKLSQSGQGGQTRNFWRPKGSLALAWTPLEGLALSMNIARTVGQLSFSDFLAEVFLENRNANAGNAALKPTMSWESDFEINKNLGAWGSAGIRFYANWIDDYIDIIPLPGGGESPGNIDSARLYGIESNSTFNLDTLGWAGARLDIGFTLEDSSVNDPLTGEKRAFSNLRDRKAELALRHDLVGSDWAWGAELEYFHAVPSYRLSEVNLQYEGPIYTLGFIEHKDVFGMTVRFQVFNLTDGRAILDRTVYAGPRDNSPLLFRENQKLKVGPIYSLQISGTF